MEIWISLFVSSVPILLAIFFWRWLLPRHTPKSGQGPDNDEGNNPRLPEIPISPYSPTSEWFTDRFEKSTESKVTELS